LAFDYQVETNEIYSHSAKGKDLRFNEIKIYNKAASLSFYILSYFAETATYNFSLVTRIINQNGENYFVTTINVAPKDSKRFAPFADIIEVKSKTTLAEHYRVLAKVLNEMRKQDETNWIWNKAKNELNYLSRVIERDLGEYNLEGIGSAIVIDSSSLFVFVQCYLRFRIRHIMFSRGGCRRSLGWSGMWYSFKHRLFWIFAAKFAMNQSAGRI
jgi:hypothetical protein